MAKEVARIGKQVLTEDDLRIEHEIDGERFVMRYPSPAVRRAIENTISRMLDLQPRDLYPDEHIWDIRTRATIYHIIVDDESPDWFDALNCYAGNIHMELWEAFVQFSNRFSKRLRAGGYAPGSSES